MFKKNKRARIKKFLDAAKGQECTFRGPTCNGNPETVVACHLHGAGMGQKNHDFEIFFGCSGCHKHYDAYGVYTQGFLDQEGHRVFLETQANEARKRTMLILHEMGLL